MCGGSSLWNGNPNPVTLVNTVVARKIAVHPLSCFPAISPSITTRPERIPTRLIRTWMSVYVAVVIPKIMISASSAKYQTFAARSSRNSGKRLACGRTGTGHLRQLLGERRDPGLERHRLGLQRDAANGRHALCDDLSAGSCESEPAPTENHVERG